jgi:flagellar export protein FliJ
MRIRDNRLRLQQWQLAERQRYLAELESLIARLRGDAERLREEIDTAALRGLAGERTAAYQLFVRPLIERREKLARTISTIEEQIEEARGAVLAAQQEVRIFGETGLPARAVPLHQRRRPRQRAS